MRSVQLEHLTFEVPEDWEIREPPPVDTLFLAIVPGEFGDFSPQLNVTTVGVSEAIDEGLFKMGNQIGLQKHVIDFEALESEPTARESLRYSGLMEGCRFIAQDFFVVTGGQGLVFHFKSPVGDFEQWEPDVLAVGASIRTL